MEPQTPRVARRSLKDQMANTSELLRSLRSPSTSFNSSSHQEPSVPSISSPLAANSSVTAPVEVSSPSGHSSHNEPQQQHGIQLLPVDDYSPQPRARASRNFDSHRMSMYSVQGELTYQREAEKQLMATVSTAKKNLRGDFLFVLLERVAVQSISLYNTAEPDQLEEIDALCVMLSDYVKRYAEQSAIRLEQEMSPPDLGATQRNFDGVDRILSSVDRAHDLDILHATAPTPTIRDNSYSRELGTLHETKRESKPEREAARGESRGDAPVGEPRREPILQRSSSRSSRTDLRNGSRPGSRNNREPPKSDSHKSDLHKNASSREVSGTTRSTSATSSRNSSWRSKSHVISPPQSPPLPQPARASTPSRSHSRMQEVIEKLRNRK